MVRGAAQVVDHMAIPADDLQAMKEGILSATAGLDEQQIEALLQDNVSMFVSCTVAAPYHLETNQQETEQKIASHKRGSELENIVGSLVVFAVAARQSGEGGKTVDVEFQDRWLAVKEERLAAPVHSLVSSSGFMY